MKFKANDGPENSLLTSRKEKCSVVNSEVKSWEKRRFLLSVLSDAAAKVFETFKSANELEKAENCQRTWCNNQWKLQSSRGCGRFPKSLISTSSCSGKYCEMKTVASCERWMKRINELLTCFYCLLQLNRSDFPIKSRSLLDLTSDGLYENDWQDQQRWLPISFILLYRATTDFLYSCYYSFIFYLFFLRLHSWLWVSAPGHLSEFV